jgi:hypothetical protein
MPSTTRSQRTAPSRRGARFRREQPQQSRMQKLLGALPGRNKPAKRGGATGIRGKLSSLLSR